MFSPFDLPSGILLLVTDQLSSPGDFVLHRSLIDHLKTAKSSNTKALVLSVSNDLARWKAIAAKSNLTLDQQSASGAFTFVDVLERVRPPDTDSFPTPPLRPILDTVVSALEKFNGPDMLVIVDDLATLDWLGFPVLDITRFCRALHAACRKANATLLLRQHVLTPPATDPELDDLFRALIQMCTYHLEVLPLSSGRSGTVSGQVSHFALRDMFALRNFEVALHAGPGTPRGEMKLVPRSSALQYKLTDGGAVFFERGTGAGVL